MRLRACSKINLCLDVIGKRPDGYHLLESIMQSLKLSDIVWVKKTRSSKISVTCDKIDIPQENNIAYKAAKRFFEYSNLPSAGVGIKIKKRIPSEAGMGGGSADAAAVIVALNKLFKTNYSEATLCEIGEKVGADVPFCISGGTKLVRGIGEILTKIAECPKWHFVIVKGNQGVSTKEAYEDLDNADRLKFPSLRIEKVIDILYRDDIDALKGMLINVFEQTTRLTEIEKITQTLRENGAVEAAMTGSGSACFGVFKHKRDAKKCVKALKGSYNFVCYTTPSTRGVL